jgi:dimethylpropiothetin dethiomethylase
LKSIAKNSWIRLLAGFYLTYESASGGGSEIIVNHLEQITNVIRKILDNPEFECKKPLTQPVCKHLTDALKMGKYYIDSPIYQSIGVLKEYLTWEQDENRISDDLKEKYAYSQIVGPNGPFVCNEMNMGMILLAPNAVYHLHKHHGFEESYICLGGVAGINDCNVLTTNTLTYNPSGEYHKLTTDAEFPVLLSYAWINEKE